MKTFDGTTVKKNAQVIKEGGWTPEFLKMACDGMEMDEYKKLFITKVVDFIASRPPFADEMTLKQAFIACIFPVHYEEAHKWFSSSIHKATYVNESLEALCGDEGILQILVDGYFCEAEDTASGVIRYLNQ